jgi:hypothetical protein
MNWLYEQPLAIVVVGVLVLIALGAAWSATGRQELMYALATAFLLMVAALVTERLVVTDREAIEATLLTIAKDVQSNNIHALTSHVYSGAPELKQKAEAEMPNYHFTECRLTKIHNIEVDVKAQPRTAVAEFNVVATGSFKAEGMEVSNTIPRWVRLNMVREKDGTWAVQNYEHDDPTRFMMKDAGHTGRTP